jgi:hypothetical protein
MIFVIVTIVIIIDEHTRRTGFNRDNIRQHFISKDQIFRFGFDNIVVL